MSLLTQIESNKYRNMFLVAISEFGVWTVIEGDCIRLNVKQIAWSKFRRNSPNSVAADSLYNV